MRKRNGAGRVPRPPTAEDERYASHAGQARKDLARAVQDRAQPTDAGVATPVSKDDFVALLRRAASALPDLGERRRFVADIMMEFFQDTEKRQDFWPRA